MLCYNVSKGVIAMKRFVCFFIAIFLSLSASAQLTAYDVQIYQVEPGGGYFLGRWFHPSSPTTSAFLMYDGVSSQPKVGAIGTGFSWDGSTLNSTGIDSAYLTTVLASYATSAALVSGLNGKFNIPSGSASNCVRGDGSISTCTAVKSFNYATKTLNSCFQLSSTRDVQVTYPVEIGTSISLSGGSQGTVYLRSYTNSGCSTGTQEIQRITNGQSGTLTVGLAITQTVALPLVGVIPAGLWAQLVTENTVGAPTFTSRPGQEITL